MLPIWLREGELEGALNGRYPPRFSAGADWNVPRCGPDPTLGDRLLLLGGVNGRYPPEFPVFEGRLFVLGDVNGR